MTARASRRQGPARALRPAALLLCALSLLCPGAVLLAQEAAPAAEPEAQAEAVPTATPKGPADIISGARKAREQREMRQAVEAGETATPTQASAAGEGEGEGAALPPGHPPADQAVPVASPHAGVAGAPGARRPPPNEVRAASDLQTGQLRVRVLDQAGRPVPGASIRLGILRSMGERDAKDVKAGPDGQHVFSGLDVGDRQAYRVNVLADRARFSTNPFRMPHQGGMQATVYQLPTTQSRDGIVLYVGAVSVELKDERLKIAQQQRIVNVGDKVYVFPDGGMKLPLPPGATAFQAEETMTDQRVSSDEEHVIIEGSIAPGQVTLLWGFDIPIDGSEQQISLDNPFTTFAYRVLSDAPEGMTLSVKGFPPAQLHEGEGKRFWVTEVQRSPDQSGLKRIVIDIKGIPGPGPLRWIAAGLAVIAIVVGFLFTRRREDEAAPHLDVDALEESKAALLEEMRGLTAERKAEAIGPEYFAEERERIVDELAVVLWQLQDVAAQGAGSGSAPKGKRV